MKFALGQAVPRTEDPRLLTGRGRYIDDFVLPRLAHACVLRSPLTDVHHRCGGLGSCCLRGIPQPRRVVFRGGDDPPPSGLNAALQTKPQFRFERAFLRHEDAGKESTKEGLDPDRLGQEARGQQYHEDGRQFHARNPRRSGLIRSRGRRGAQDPVATSMCRRATRLSPPQAPRAPQGTSGRTRRAEDRGSPGAIRKEHR